MDFKYGIAGARQLDFKAVFNRKIKLVLLELNIDSSCVEVRMGYDTLQISIVCNLAHSVLDQLVQSIDVIMNRTKEVVNGSENYKCEIFNEPKF